MSQCCSHGAGDTRAQTVAGLLERPRYSPGLILQDADLTSAVDYTRELSRLLFRSLFGCGVVCGLQVSVNTDCDLQVTIAPGLGLDGCGDPIQLTRSVTITLTERDGFPRTGRPNKQDFWVVLCGKEKYCAPRTIVCDSDDQDGTTQTTRVREQAEVSIVFKQPACICGHVLPDPTPDNLKKAALDLVNPDKPQTEPPPQADCPEDCGCADPCGCECCVLLAWVHWFEPTQGNDAGWSVLHRGVRRFVRPQMAVDPIDNRRPAAFPASPNPPPAPPNPN
jgi:hypothetical protein